MTKIAINMKAGKIDKPSDTIIGIDLGTTNSLVATIIDGTATLVKDKNGKNALVPSIIHFTENQEMIVGEEAKEFLISDPENTLFSIKRLIGKTYNDVKSQQNYFSYRIIDEEDNSMVKIAIGERFYSPIELSAKILKTLKHRVEKQTGKKVRKAVITVPAYFNDGQRQATKDAGKLAGLDVLRIINEPTSASLAYGIGLAPEEEQTIAVYDLGGGTFDISILHIHDSVFEVLSTNGDTFLGGDDFDRLIVDFWLNKSNLDTSILISDKSFAQKIRLSAEEAKKHLSTSIFFETSINGNSYKISIKEFNDLIEPLIEKTLSLCQRAITDANIDINNIDQILLVGGSTRTPLVKSKLRDFFNKELNDKINPDEVVAIGAAIQADILAGNNKNMLLLDITPLSLGIETVGGLMDIIVPRNSKLPIKVGRNYTTSIDGQKNLKLAVYQGERDLVIDNRKLGEFILSGIPPMATGLPKIAIHFIINADGILKVKAKEERSNIQSEIIIKSQYGLSEEAMSKMLIDSIQHAEEDVAVRALLEARNEAQNIISATKKFINQNDWLSTVEIESLKSLNEQLEESVKKENKDAINKAIEQINEYARPLAEKSLDINVAKALKERKI